MLGYPFIFSRFSIITLLMSSVKMRCADLKDILDGSF